MTALALPPVGRLASLLRFLLPLKGDGTLDDRELKFLDDLTRWMDINSEGIYGTRPFRILGEENVRFTTKGRALYAFYLGLFVCLLTVACL